jgi:hypothetical protein
VLPLRSWTTWDDQIDEAIQRDIDRPAITDIDAPGPALAVGAALCSVAAFQVSIARRVIDAIAPGEWVALREARLRSWMEPVRLRPPAAQ